MSKAVRVVETLSSHRVRCREVLRPVRSKPAPIEIDKDWFCCYSDQGEQDSVWDLKNSSFSDDQIAELRSLSL